MFSVDLKVSLLLNCMFVSQQGFEIMPDVPLQFI